MSDAAAKAGIAAMTIALARELERCGARVNTISRLTEAVAGDRMQVAEGDVDRFAPADLGAAASRLARPLAAGIAGRVLTV